jgi:hypothetical protein
MGYCPSAVASPFRFRILLKVINVKEPGCAFMAVTPFAKFPPHGWLWVMPCFPFIDLTPCV